MLFDETSILNRALQDPKSNITSALDNAGLTIQGIMEKKADPDAFDELMATVHKFANENDIQVPSTTNQRGRRTNASKRARTESIIDPIERYKGYYAEIVDMFVEELSQRFNTENYRPLIAISNILISIEKPQISDVFFDLGVYRQEIGDMMELDIELTHWYRYKDLHRLKTITEVHNEFAIKNLKSLFPNIFVLLSIFFTVPFSSADLCASKL